MIMSLVYLDELLFSVEGNSELCNKKLNIQQCNQALQNKLKFLLISMHLQIECIYCNQNIQGVLFSSIPGKHNLKLK